MRLARVLILLLSLTVVTGNPAGAATDTRVALVIGNSAYRNANELHTPKRDAIAIGAALERIGFEVDLHTDLNQLGMRHACATSATRPKRPRSR